MGTPLTTAEWVLIGTITLGVAIFVYVVLFCPTNCL